MRIIITIITDVKNNIYIYEEKFTEKRQNKTSKLQSLHFSDLQTVVERDSRGCYLGLTRVSE